MAIFITHEGGIIDFEDVQSVRSAKVPAIVKMVGGSLEDLARQELRRLGLDERIVLDRGGRQIEFQFFNYLKTNRQDPFDFTACYIEKHREDS